MKLDNLRKLFLHELRDLRDAESRMTEVLPRMEQAASDEGLKKVLHDHTEASRKHKEKVEKILADLGESPEGETCRGMAGIIGECEDMMKVDAGDKVRDAGLIATAQRMEHYEIAGYGAVRTYAHVLGEENARESLQEILEGEGRMNKHLTELAARQVNLEAAKA